MTDTASMQHFHALGRQAQADAIRRLAALGHSPHTIAAATHLSVESVRQILTLTITGDHPCLS